MRLSVMATYRPLFQKPEPRRRVKARKNRHESAVKQSVRAQCVERDGYCLVGPLTSLGDCEGPSEWAHFHSHRRSKTRGQPAEERHTVEGSGMMCRRHHKLYDAKRFDLKDLA